MSDEIDTGAATDDLEAGQLSEPLEVTPNNYVTPDVLESRIQFALDQAKRYAQSLTDKSSDRITKAIKEQEQSLLQRVEILRKAGHDVTDDEMAAARADIKRKVLSGELQMDQDEDEPPAQAPPPPDYRMQARVLAAQSRVAQAIAEAGFAIEDRDRELTAVQTKAQTPEEWEQSYYQAMKRKAARMGKTFAAPEQAEPNAIPPAARMPGGTGQGAGAAPQTLEAKTAELTKLQKKTGKTQADWTRMEQLEKEILQVMR